LGDPSEIMTVLFQTEMPSGIHSTDVLYPITDGTRKLLKAFTNRRTWYVEFRLKQRRENSMLHRLIHDCVQELLELVLLQKWMLEFAEANSAYSDAAFRAFMPNEFVDWIITLRTGSNRGAKIANRFVQELTEYVKCPQPDKSQVLAEFILDQEYYNRINDPSFTFSLLPSKSVTHEKAKKCLVEFYEFLGEGYPSVLVGFPAQLLQNSVVTGYVNQY
jgi:hypothetical protein